MKQRVLFLVVFVFAGALARAHDPGLSTVQGRVTDAAIRIVAGYSPADARRLLQADGAPTAAWTKVEFEQERVALERAAGQFWELRVGGEAVGAGAVTVQWNAADNVSLSLVFPRGKAGRIAFRARELARLPAGHREFVTFEDALGGLIARKLLSVKNDEVEFDPPRAERALVTAGEPAAPPGFWEFFKLGVEHIWTGYDHLLFLFGLLIVCRSFRSIVTVVSCFTLAHSITLALATLGWIDLPGSFVEPAIAASIVYVGVENLLRRGKEPPGRWALTFGFGLVHGLGFASVLRDLGVGAGGQGLGLPLFAFNLGVEVGQVAIAAVVLPTVWRLRKNDTFALRGVPVLSALVAVLGLWWVIERLTG